MDVTEARVRCLELSAQLLRSQGLPPAEDVVKIATKLYDYVVSEPPPGETQAGKADKPTQRKPSKADLLR